MRELLILVGVAGVLLLGILWATDRRTPESLFEKTCLEGVTYWLNKGNGYGPAMTPVIDSVTLQPTRC